MTREKALAASRALDAIDGFHIFMEEIDKAIDSAEELELLLDTEFKSNLDSLLKTELERLKKVLEDL